MENSNDKDFEERLFNRFQQEVFRSHLSIKEVDSELHRDLVNKIKNLENKIEDINGKIVPVLEALRTAGSVRKALLWLSSLVLSITGAGFGLKEIYKWFHLH